MSSNPVNPVNPVLQGPRPDIQAIYAEASGEMLANAVSNTNITTTTPPPPPTTTTTLLTSLGYYFDQDGYLRDESHKRPTDGQLNANTSSDIVAAVADYVHNVLNTTYKFYPILIPTLTEAVIPEARAPIFFSENYEQKEKLLVIIQGSGRGLKPGIWSRTLCMTEGLNMGSMLPQIQMALHHDYAVIILNPNERHYFDTSKDGTPIKIPIKYSERPENQMLYVWEKFVVPSQAKDIYLLGYGYGGEVIRHCLSHLANVQGQYETDRDNANKNTTTTTTTTNGKEFKENNDNTSNETTKTKYNASFATSLNRIAAVALMESSHRIEATRDHPKLVQFCKRNMINWKSSYQAFGYLIEHRGQEHSRQYMQGCLCISSGDCGTNVAISIRKVLKSIFEFYSVARKERKLQRKSIGDEQNKQKETNNVIDFENYMRIWNKDRPSITKRFWKIQSQKLKLRKEQAEKLKNTASTETASSTSSTTDTTYSTEQKDPSLIESSSTSSGLTLRASWNPDTSNCELCLDRFTFWNRRHHCRICGRVVCATCSQNRLFVPGYRGAARVCSSCFEVEMGQTTRVSILTEDTTDRPSNSNNMSPQQRQQNKTSKLGVDDFQLIKVLGKGAFGKVFMVKRKTDSMIYAMKVLHKDKVKKQRQIEHTQTERWVLAETSHPFITKLRFAFQSIRKLYLVMDYMVGGELFFHLQKEGRFSEDKTRFYAAELVSALSYLHSEEGGHVVYRDLKPENLLIDAQGHIQVTDFGLAKKGVKTPNGATTFVGSPEYVAPEVLASGRYGYGYGKAVDWWSLGTLIYEMLNGLPPFYDRNKQVMFEQIQYSKLIFPNHFSASSQAMLCGLLTRDPSLRLGSGDEGSMNIRSCPFFTNINWLNLENRQITPPWVPPKQGVDPKTDSSNFDTRDVSMTSPGSLRSSNNKIKINSNQKLSPMFGGFTFVPEEDGNHLMATTLKNTSLRQETQENDELASSMSNGDLRDRATTEDVLGAMRVAMEALEVETNVEERKNLESEIQEYKSVLENDEDDGLFDDYEGTY